MGNENNKCKAQGCSKWVVHGHDSGFCSDHECKPDPLSALYVDKSPEQASFDDKVVEFFSYLLKNRNLEELLF
ncbi:MAG: hypothetical protein WC828_01270 [Thermoleophilia bacterium]|jgi:hypothetical protein